jgi:hypothetical protein
LNSWEIPGRTIDLTYCTNVHALATLETWRETMAFFGPALREKLRWQAMPLGLWWQATLAQEVAQNPRAMVDDLDAWGIKPFTCNGFPYGDFHEAVVKTKVYLPDWTQPERLSYTQTCATLMAAFKPAGGLASLSTLPLGWRHFLNQEALPQAARNLVAYAQFARDLEDKTGVRVALGLEPEPGCTLERTSQVVDFWNQVLRPAARGKLDEATLGRYVGLCYDTCHQAVQFEKASEALGTLHSEGIAIHKMQLSSALEFAPDYSPSRPSGAARLAFAEPKFLHQTRVQTATSAHDKPRFTVQDFDDLPEALAKADWKAPWRTHYHVPLQAKSLVNETFVGTTRADMVEAYHYALRHDLCRHFEVETYTWSVLPEGERPQTPAALVLALARELEYVVANTPTAIAIRHRLA